MMEEAEKLNALQELLTDAYVEYVGKRHRKVSDTEFAKYLGVPPGSYNQWANGSRLPNYENTLRLASILGPRVFDIMGYQRVMVVNDPQIIFIAERWRLLNHDTKKQIIDHVREEVAEGETKPG